MPNFRRTLSIVGLVLASVMSVLSAIVPAIAEAADAAVQIELRAEANLTGRACTVGDLAVVRASDARLSEELGRIKVGKAPRIGAVEQMTRDELAQLLRSRTAGRDWKIDWSGARAVRIRTASQPVDGTALSDATRAYLSAELKSRVGHADVQLAGQIPEIAVPLGQVSYRPRAIESLRNLARVPVWVDIAVDGEIYRSALVPLTAKATRQVYVAKRDLPEGAAVSLADLEVGVEDVVDALDEPVRISTLSGNERLRQGVSRGQALMRKHVLASGAIRRGDAVTLRFAEGGVSIEASAVAQHDADLGQVVRVKTGSGTDSVAARVVSPGTVRVE